MSEPLNVLILAGEHSGDQHAARILRALKTLRPGLQARGFGGERLQAEGMDILQHVRDLSVMGFSDVVKRLSFFKRIFRNLVEEVRKNPPDVIVLVDYPGFNLRFAKAVRDLGIPTVQYVCPQVWAWKQSRIPKMAKTLDRLICIFPFEPPLFETTGLPAFYCGHPLVEETQGVEADADWRPDVPKLALLPGSRHQEIERLFLPMLLAAKELLVALPNLQIRVAAADDGLKSKMEGMLAGAEFPVPVDISTGKTRALLKGADAALVTSGTATLETALLETPMAVVYKTSPLTYAIGKRVVKVPHISMVNLVAVREVCPELIQHAATPDALARAVRPLLDMDSPERRAMLEGLSDVRRRLNSDEGGQAPARCILDAIP